MRRQSEHGDVAASSVQAFAFTCALGATAVSMPLVALRWGYDASEIGMFVAVSAISQIMTRMALPAAMRAWPDRSLVVWAGLLLAAGNGLLAVGSASAYSFLGAAFLQGAARASFWTGGQTHVVRGHRPAVQALGHFQLVGAIGTVVGPTTAGVLISHSPALGLWMGAAAALLSVLPAMALDRLPPFQARAERPPGRRLRGRPGVRAGCVAVGCDGTWRALLESYVPVVLDAARHSSVVIGALVSGANAASALGTLGVARTKPSQVAGWMPPAILCVGLGTTALVLAADHLLAAALAIAVCGIGSGALQTIGPATATMAADADEMGEAIALTGTVRAAAYFLTPMAVAGLLTALPLAGVLALTGAAMASPAFVLHRRGPGPVPPRRAARDGDGP